MGEPIDPLRTVHTHVRPLRAGVRVGVEGSWSAEIMSYRPNRYGEIPVQFDDESFGTIDVAGIGTDLELWTPCLEPPDELWFTLTPARRIQPGSHHNPLAALQDGPYPVKQNHFPPDEQWVRYRLVQ